MLTWRVCSNYVIILHVYMYVTSNMSSARFSETPSYDLTVVVVVLLLSVVPGESQTLHKLAVGDGSKSGFYQFCICAMKTGIHGRNTIKIRYILLLEVEKILFSLCSTLKLVKNTLKF